MFTWVPFRQALAVTAAVGLCGIAQLHAGAAVTVGTLLHELSDPEYLTRFPDPGYRLLHASSYDRRSITPGTPNWFANLDYNYVLRSETVDDRTEFVLLDATGPGVIVHFWTTTFGHEYTLRVYLDGVRTPVIEGSLTQVVGRDGFIGPPLSFVAPVLSGTSVGHNLYLPIPFNQRCKITVSTPLLPLIEPHHLFYNIDYRVYDSGTEVESYTQDALTRYSAEYAATQFALNAGHPALTATSACSRIEGALPWGGGTRSVTLAGPSAVRLMRFRLAAPDLDQALRSTHLEMDFDDEVRSVACPVGDFFGTGCCVTTGGTWYAKSLTNGTMEVYWPMPFSRRATIRVVNHGLQPVDVCQGEVWSGPYTWDAAASMHFHSAWRDYAFEDSVAQKGKDLNYVTLQGEGRYVGDALSVFNDTTVWWGEGDEKIYVDGETFPSHFGTGTEDYYGYAWCQPNTFSTPFNSQPLGDGNNHKGRTVNVRVRPLDNIPYRSGLRFDMEFWAWQTGRCRFAPTVFWYARPGGRCFSPDPVPKSLLPIPRSTSGVEYAPALCPIGVRAEAESMSVAQLVGGTVTSVSSNGLGLSSDRCLRWRDCHVGDRLTLSWTAGFEGQCRLAARFLSAPATGILRISVNDRVVTNASLLASAAVPVLLDLGSHVLQKGVNTLGIEVTALPPDGGETGFYFDYVENEGPYYVARVAPVVRQRLEGESLRASSSSGSVGTRASSCGLSGGLCAFWRDAVPGATAAFRFESNGERQVPLSGVFLCATNGGVCDVSVNGTTVCGGLDLRRSAPATTNVFLGEHVLTDGTNALEVLVTGCDTGLDSAHLSVGLDCLDIGSVYARRADSLYGLPLLGPYEDPDHDGLMNLFEYAFGGDPSVPDGHALWPQPSLVRRVESTYPAVSYRRREPLGPLAVVGEEGVNLQVDGVAYQVQETQQLGSPVCWTNADARGRTLVVEGTPDDASNGTVSVRMRVTQPLDASAQPERFMRVRVYEP